MWRVSVPLCMYLGICMKSVFVCMCVYVTEDMYEILMCGECVCPPCMYLCFFCMCVYVTENMYAIIGCDV